VLLFFGKVREHRIYGVDSNSHSILQTALALEQGGLLQGNLGYMYTMLHVQCMKVCSIPQATLHKWFPNTGKVLASCLSCCLVVLLSGCLVNNVLSCCLQTLVTRTAST
jgi:hypothetical protein